MLISSKLCDFVVNGVSGHMHAGVPINQSQGQHSSCLGAAVAGILLVILPTPGGCVAPIALWGWLRTNQGQHSAEGASSILLQPFPPPTLVLLSRSAIQPPKH